MPEFRFCRSVQQVLQYLHREPAGALKAPSPIHSATQNLDPESLFSVGVSQVSQIRLLLKIVFGFSGIHFEIHFLWCLVP